jgi:hypothetical protein
MSKQINCLQGLDASCHISLDIWELPNLRKAILGIIVHYIDDEWNLCERLINFQEIHGRHTGENLAEAVMDTLETYNIITKFWTVMGDNASNNDTLASTLCELLAAHDVCLNPDEIRMRCAPHYIHLAAKEIVKAVNSTLPKKRGWQC